jgi:hypothetical protein
MLTALTIRSAAESAMPVIRFSSSRSSRARSTQLGVAGAIGAERVLHVRKHRAGLHGGDLQRLDHLGQRAVLYGAQALHHPDALHEHGHAQDDRQHIGE